MSGRHFPEIGLGLIVLSSLLGGPANARADGPATPCGEQAAARDPDPVRLSACLTQPGSDRRAELCITAFIQPGFHIYSTTQPAGGPHRSQIKLVPSEDYRIITPFVAIPPPRAKWDSVFDGLPLEEHHGAVTWRATVELAHGVRPGKLAIAGSLVTQADNDVQGYCLAPADYGFAAIVTPAPPSPRLLARVLRVVLRD